MASTYNGGIIDMAGFQDILDGLRKAEREVEAQLAGIRGAIASMAQSSGRKQRGRPSGKRAGGPSAQASDTGATPRKRKRTISAAGRAAIAAAQKARWARFKAGQKK